MSITKEFLADQIVHARHGFEKNNTLPLETLKERCKEVFELIENHTREELFKIRDEEFKKLQHDTI